ncbi:MAG: YkgJ family cysteine cluster protein [Planctomycetota bacterium]
MATSEMTDPGRTDPGVTNPGLAGVVPFRFHCHRCGHCCTAGAGYVWLAEAEIESLAEARGTTTEVFLRDCVRSVPDPRTGEPRLSLVQQDGRCALLEGTQHCSVYDARPQHCRQFPYGDAVLTDAESFERARAVCPGIAVEVAPDRTAAAFEQLAQLYASLDEAVAELAPECQASGLCCRFEEAGHELFATGLEADYAAALHPGAPGPEAAGRCPYHDQGLCTAREGRALGCRTYFCDARTSAALEELHGETLGRIREIEAQTGYPAAYGRFPALLAARGVGTASDGKRDGPSASKETS